MDFEEPSQDSPQGFRRFPDYDIHFTAPFLPSAAGAAARDQQKRHQKQQRSHWKNSGNQDARAQSYRADAKQPAAASSKHASRLPSLSISIDTGAVQGAKKSPAERRTL